MAFSDVKVTPIPDDREVIGQDIIDIAKAFGWTTLDTAFFLKVYLPRLARMTSTELTEADKREGYKKPGCKRPINDVTRAMLLRYISKHPEKCPMPEQPQPQELFEYIQSIDGMEDFKVRHIGPLLGRENTAGYRWFRGAEAAPLVSRYLRIMLEQLREAEPEARRTIIREMQALAETEATARGVDPKEIWTNGLWTPEEKGHKSKTRGKNKRKVA